MLRDAWTLAIEALSWIELRNMSERQALSKTAKQLDITNPSAKGLAHRLVYEVTRRKNYLDSIINHVFAPQLIEDCDLGVRAFLRLYVYKTRLECKGDVHREAVEIARMGRSILGWQTLQPVEKTLGTLLSLEPGKIFETLCGEEEKVAVRTCNPTWFVEYCFKLFGRGEALKILESSQESPHTYIRVNTLKAQEEEIIEKLNDEGVCTEKVSEIQHAYKMVKTSRPLSNIHSFREGLFCVQDKAGCLAVEVAAPQPDMTVFDVCAALGAKTTYLAMLMQNTGTICSLDYSRPRIRVWKHNITRMGVKNAIAVIADVRKSLPLYEPADLVVLDPPCTSTGVFARAPSAKWQVTSQSVPRIAEVQWQMLRSCAEKVKGGGWLVYCTSSICVEENEMQVERFLRCFPEFKLVETKPRVGLPGLRGLTWCQRLYPHVHECDGFFIAKLQRDA